MPNAAPAIRLSSHKISYKFANRSHSMSTAETADIKEVVKQKYGESASRGTTGGSSCFGAAPASSCCGPITPDLYDVLRSQQIPQEPFLASLRFGNPPALA